MQIRGMLIGSGATIALAAGLFAAVAIANADDAPPVPPAAPAIVETTPVPTVPPTVEPEPSASIAPTAVPTATATALPAAATAPPPVQPAPPPVEPVAPPASVQEPVPGQPPPPGYTGPLVNGVVPGTDENPVSSSCGYSDIDGNWVFLPCG